MHASSWQAALYSLRIGPNLAALFRAVSRQFRWSRGLRGASRDNSPIALGAPIAQPFGRVSRGANASGAEGDGAFAAHLGDVSADHPGTPDRGHLHACCWCVLYRAIRTIKTNTGLPTERGYELRSRSTRPYDYATTARVQ